MTVSKAGHFVPRNNYYASKQMFKDFRDTGKEPGSRKTLICHQKDKCNVTKKMCEYMKNCNGNGTCSELTG